jgi:hypothetical protein
MNNSVKEGAHYMTLPYTIVLRPAEDNDVVARIEERQRRGASHREFERDAESLAAGLRGEWSRRPSARKAGAGVPGPDLRPTPAAPCPAAHIPH